MRNLILLGGVAFGTLAAAVVADAESNPRFTPPTVQEVVAARQAAMMMSGSVHGLTRIRMDEGAEAKKVAYAADGLASWAKAIPGMFPAGTGPDVVETYAKPEVWTDRAGFLKAAENYIAQTEKLSALAHANDTDAFKAQLTVVGDACKSCHDLYQKKFPEAEKPMIVRKILVALAWTASLAAAQCAFAAPDYTKRFAPIDPSVKKQLLGKWTNPVDKLVIVITSVDVESGRLEGLVSPTTGPAAVDEHELIGWVSAAPPRENLDNVIPVSFSTTLYEYGTLPAWAGYLKDGKIVTMHYLVWPNKTYTWDHIAAFSETWTKMQ